MKRIITFDQATAILERSRMAALLEITPAPPSLARLADILDESDNFSVHAILPERGKIAFTVKEKTSSAEFLVAVCDAIESVFQSDIVISNERAEQ